MAFARFIGWRYLHRRRPSALVLALTIAFGVAALATQAAVFSGTHVMLGAFLTVPTVMLFVAFLLLNFFSVFTTVSIIGVILGVAALTVVSAVTSGFQASFKTKVLGVNAHVLVLKYGLDFSEYRDCMKRVEKVPHVLASSPFVFNEMMLAHGGSLSGVLIKGIDPKLSPHVIDISEKLTAGSINDLGVRATPNDGGVPLPQIFVGKELQKKLKAKIGDRVRVVTPKADFDPSQWTPSGGGAPQVREFRVGGVFYSGFDEYDRRLVYINVADAQAFGVGGDVVTGVEIKIDDINRARPVADDISRALGGPPYRVIDWEELNHNLFTALKLQKVALIIFLTLIVVVAAFNIVAALTMLVIDKTKEIAILKSMGMGSFGVARVFQAAGLTIGAVGVAAGIGVGLLVCAVVARFGYALDPHVYLIDKLPVKVQVDEIVLVAAITLAISLVATLAPSIKAARLKPVEGLRYE